MSDHGSIAVKDQLAKSISIASYAFFLKGIHCGYERMVIGMVRNNSEGFPSSPSIDIPVKGRYRFRWAMDSGARTISCYVKHPSDSTPRPTLSVKKNPAIGLLVDNIATAPSGTGWLQIGPVTVNPTSDGAVWVELWNNCYRQVDHCYFDLIQTG